MMSARGVPDPPLPLYQQKYKKLAFPPSPRCHEKKELWGTFPPLVVTSPPPFVRNKIFQKKDL